ncbi:MAG TPA: hypothetical protein VFM84_00425 [Holophagaceae bacterium]|nr:hypothetical protein [Holophagaceae bacterium]
MNPEDRWQGMLRNMSRIQRADEFKGLDHSTILRMTDPELAEWQSKYPPDSAQFIFANNEWQRRLAMEQVQAVKWAAKVGIVAVVVGAILGACLTIGVNFLARKYQTQTINDQSGSTSSRPQQEPVNPPVATPPNKNGH